jgi:hypothetical protein
MLQHKNNVHCKYTCKDFENEMCLHKKYNEGNVVNTNARDVPISWAYVGQPLIGRKKKFAWKFFC